MKSKTMVILIVFILLLLASSSKTMAEDAKDNANLSTMHLEYSGISPNFDKNVKEYYLIVGGEIDSIAIEAEPENRNATVTISGNEILEYGKNVVTIEVVSEDSSKTKQYKIYVTKTDEPETANANLETLAVRQGDLTPEFDNNITKYRVEIANNESTVDILAIVQNPMATVEIIGDDEMQIGENKVEVVVLAENGITDKRFEITVYRRSIDEEAATQEETKAQAERLSAIISGKNAQTQIQELTKTNTNLPAIIGSIAVIVITTTLGIVYYRKKK